VRGMEMKITQCSCRLERKPTKQTNLIKMHYTSNPKQAAHVAFLEDIFTVEVGGRDQGRSCLQPQVFTWRSHRFVLGLNETTKLESMCRFSDCVYCIA
jgi:hypothetical protein